jgi:hypothetical protein
VRSVGHPKDFREPCIYCERFERHRTLAKSLYKSCSATAARPHVLVPALTRARAGLITRVRSTRGRRKGRSARCRGMMGSASPALKSAALPTNRRIRTCRSLQRRAQCTLSLLPAARSRPSAALLTTATTPSHIPPATSLPVCCAKRSTIARTSILRPLARPSGEQAALGNDCCRF